MGCYEQPAITAITPVMAAPITLSGDNTWIYTWTFAGIPGFYLQVAHALVFEYIIHIHEYRQTRVFIFMDTRDGPTRSSPV